MCICVLGGGEGGRGALINLHDSSGSASEVSEVLLFGESPA